MAVVSPLIEVTDLCVRYGARPILEKLSFSIAPGEVLALIGPNGAGKTTLIRSLSSILPFASGQVRVLGHELAHLPPARRASFLAVVPQARDLPEYFTVWQTVMLGRTPYLGWLGQPSQKDEDRVTWALHQTATHALADRLIGQLSGGEQQRVLLARALAQDTPILLLDEPTAHLDLRYQSELLGLVRRLAQDQNLGVLMALHDLNLVALYADRVALLADGGLHSVGLPSEVLTAGNLSQAFQTPIHVVAHPDYGTPLILPDGRGPAHPNHR
jgi:iron complex transport system ATP-binding protein